MKKYIYITGYYLTVYKRNMKFGSKCPELEKNYAEWSNPDQET